MRHALAFVPLLALVACGGAGADEHQDIYAYDRSEPLAVRDNGVVNRDHPIKVRDVSFHGGKERVPAFLLTPPGKGPFPAVIYLHGSGGDRFELLQSAGWLAGRRAVALTVESAYSPNRAVELGPGVQGLRNERNRTVQEIVELRRAVDLLQSLPQVDDERIGFVGYSAGARSGAILAGVEKRIKAFVLMSGGEDTVDEFMALVPDGQQDEVRPLLEDTDGLRYIADASPSKLFFQVGRRDRIVPRDALQTLIRAGSEPKKVAWYDAGHALGARAQRDQLAWLSEVLPVDGPPVEGAQIGP
ncbi:MAG: acetylxylan esterase [Actinomycetota bacterium]|nr:acetylxylan esterase [Actinomycetota bacterium]